MAKIMIKLTKQYAPFWKHGESARSMAADRLVACAVLLVLPVVRYGFRPLLMTLAVMLTAVLTEMLMCLFLRREVRVADLDSLVIGAMIALLMPVNVAYYVPAFAAVFAVAVAKMPFGGTGHAPFEPAAAGVAFSVLCFPSLVFAYCSPAAGRLDLNIFVGAEAAMSQSPAAMLRAGARPVLLLSEMFTGNVAAPVGAATVVVVAAAALFLYFRHAARWEITVCFMGAAALVAALFPRISTGRADSVIIELSAGSLAFCAAFLATNTANAPKLPLARCFYGFLGGLVTMLFRYFGAYEQGAVFAILLVNTTAAPLDRLAWKLTGEERKNDDGEKRSNLANKPA